MDNLCYLYLWSHIHLKTSEPPFLHGLSMGIPVEQPWTEAWNPEPLKPKPYKPCKSQTLTRTQDLNRTLNRLAFWSRSMLGILLIDRNLIPEEGVWRGVLLLWPLVKERRWFPVRHFSSSWRRLALGGVYDHNVLGPLGLRFRVESSTFMD